MATSSVIDQVVEAMNDAFSRFNPESVFPDVDAFLENLPKITEALAENLKKASARLEPGEMPIKGEVAEALREMIPSVNVAGDKAGEAFQTFCRLHEQEREQHLNPRTREDAWNTRA